MEIEVKDEDFKEKVLKSNLPILVDFYATWCGPCRMIAPFIEQISNEFDGKIMVARIDVDEAPLVSKMLNILSIPTILLFNEGKAVNSFEGYRDKDEIKDFINECLDKIDVEK